MLAAVGASETFSTITTPLSRHTHLLLRKASTCTGEAHRGWSLCISVDISNNHLCQWTGVNARGKTKEVGGGPFLCHNASPQCSTGDHQFCWQSWGGVGNKPRGHPSPQLIPSPTPYNCTLRCVRLEESVRTQLFLRGIS